jgi:hypothetical protein
MTTILDKLMDGCIPEPNSGCWLWLKCEAKGYGKIRFKNKLATASRVSYETFICDPGDKHVLHKCDNPLCINPEHLFLGTHDDNMRDKVSKNRSMKGSKNPCFGRTGIKHPMFGRKGGNNSPSLKQKLAVQMTNIMRFNPYWGA